MYFPGPDDEEELEYLRLDHEQQRRRQLLAEPDLAELFEQLKRLSWEQIRQDFEKFVL